MRVPSQHFDQFYDKSKQEKFFSQVIARQPGLRERRVFPASSIEKPVANSGYLSHCKWQT